MKIIIGIIVFIFVIAYLGDKSSDKTALKHNITFYDSNCKYICGFPDIAGKKTIPIKIQNNQLIFSKYTIYDKQPLKTFNREDLVDAEIMTQTQITQEVSAGKILLFGALAFGMKNSSTIQENYLVITYKYKDKEKNRQIILKPYKNLQQTTKIIREFIGVA